MNILGLFSRKKKEGKKKKESTAPTPKENPIILSVKADVAGKNFRISNSNEDKIGISWGELSKIMILIPDLVERMRILNKQVQEKQKSNVPIL